MYVRAVIFVGSVVNIITGDTTLEACRSASLLVAPHGDACVHLFEYVSIIMREVSLFVFR